MERRLQAEQHNQDEQREAIRGVFSSQEVRKLGTGTTQRKIIQKSLWFCEEKEDGSIEVQLLNSNYVPSGSKKTLPRDRFLSSFSPEPEIYSSSVFPKMRELTQTIARGNRYRQNNKLYSAEMEYGNAIKVDEENVRANFGLGITYLERGERAKADNIFKRLVKLEAAFEKEHKHLFNEFGIKLRKTGMHDQAVSYYNRALELSSRDEHLFYNLARVYLEKKDYGSALENLLHSLKLNPTLDVSVKFLLWMVHKQLVPDNRKIEVSKILQQIRVA
jgi:Tfp pilus assembly protein PilF